MLEHNPACRISPEEALKSTFLQERKDIFLRALQPIESESTNEWIFDEEWSDIFFFIKINKKLSTHQRFIDLRVRLSYSSPWWKWALVYRRDSLVLLVRLLFLNWVPVKTWLILNISSTPTTSLIPFGIWEAITVTNSLLASWSQ